MILKKNYSPLLSDFPDSKKHWKFCSNYVTEIDTNIVFDECGGGLSGSDVVTTARERLVAGLREAAKTAHSLTGIIQSSSHMGSLG